jgi:hypothetical protein
MAIIIRSRSLTGLGPIGPTGVQGNQGPQGVQGNQGAAGTAGSISDYKNVWTTASAVTVSAATEQAITLTNSTNELVWTGTGSLTVSATGSYLITLKAIWTPTASGSGYRILTMKKNGILERSWYKNAAVATVSTYQNVAGLFYLTANDVLTFFYLNSQGNGTITGIEVRASKIGSGPKGDAVWLNGSGAPSSGTGSVGNYYVNNANGDYYEKTGSTTWTSRGNLKGTTGSQGIPGIQGTAGATITRTPSAISGTTTKTATFAAAHGLSVGMAISLSGITTPTSANESGYITAVTTSSPYQITYTKDGGLTGGSVTTLGSALVTAYYGYPSYTSLKTTS